MIPSIVFQDAFERARGHTSPLSVPRTGAYPDPDMFLDAIQMGKA